MTSKLIILGLVLFSASASADEKSTWLSAKLYGHDNSYAALRAVTIRAEGEKYFVRIKNQFSFECQLSFNEQGEPFELMGCVSMIGPGDPDYSLGQAWEASPEKIRLSCSSNKKEKICRGTYTLKSEYFKSKEKMVIARSL